MDIFVTVLVWHIAGCSYIRDCQLLAYIRAILAIPGPVANLVVCLFPLITAYFFQCKVSDGHIRVPKYSIRYSTEYSSSKLLDSATLAVVDAGRLVLVFVS